MQTEVINQQAQLGGHHLAKLASMSCFFPLACLGNPLQPAWILEVQRLLTQIHIVHYSSIISQLYFPATSQVEVAT